MATINRDVHTRARVCACVCACVWLCVSVAVLTLPCAGVLVCWPQARQIREHLRSPSGHLRDLFEVGLGVIDGDRDAHLGTFCVAGSLAQKMYHEMVLHIGNQEIGTRVRALSHTEQRKDKATLRPTLKHCGQ